jgi:prepilin-type processing-associated H-X9-DG protein
VANFQLSRMCNPPLKSRHPGGVMILMCDGSVTFISDTIDVDMLYRISDRNDGVVVSSAL